MKILARKTVDPLHLGVEVSFSFAELGRIFPAGGAGPDQENLFYALFGPAWGTLSGPEQLLLLARLARLIEQSAPGLGLTLGQPRAKSHE